MKLEVRIISASELGVPLPIDTKGKLVAIYNKGRLIKTYDNHREASDGVQILHRLMGEINKEIEDGRVTPSEFPGSDN